MTIVALHFLQRILTTFPRTFSSAMVYLAWQDWHWIFIAEPSLARCAWSLLCDCSQKSANCIGSIAVSDQGDQADGPWAPTTRFSRLSGSSQNWTSELIEALAV